MNTLLSLNRDGLFRPFEDRFNRLFDEFFGSESENAVRSLSRSGYPKLDVLHTKDGQFRVEAALPGVKLDQLKVEILPWQESNSNVFGLDSTERKVLKISGKMDYAYQYSQETEYQVKELRRSYFERTLLLPENLIGEPDAVLENGILRLTWETKPKLEKPKANLINVREIKS